jgi:hypothetical protein
LHVQAGVPAESLQVPWLVHVAKAVVAQVEPQYCCPATQPHTQVPNAVDVQVALPAATEGQAVHDVPHELTELSARH